jgi:hypothetical protein
MSHPSPFKTPEGEARFRAAYDAGLKLWPIPYEELDVPTRFGMTHVVAAGPTNAPALVLLHGLKQQRAEALKRTRTSDSRTNRQAAVTTQPCTDRGNDRRRRTRDPQVHDAANYHAVAGNFPRGLLPAALHTRANPEKVRAMARRCWHVTC